ncbi:GNAT family N-acetyltransferase [Novacetimonas pomaceti]|uniref:GNAT family N-acetyltransferase n=1 Tax=Novacetimonas pomaceti TaxID=2021998 RepID=UPI001C2CD2EF|nr:GNAT family N-acetyltransferase [Novacetimonas pomaceti]MBV1833993.1 GNAT family N-acetyltransferase [Novacetimonas pomaceti]
MIEIYQVDKLAVSVFEAVLNLSGLAEHRPIHDRERLQRMRDNSNLIVVTKDIQLDKIIGISCAITDYSYCCYLSDLAVDQAYQGSGIGR